MTRGFAQHNIFYPYPYSTTVIRLANIYPKRIPCFKNDVCKRANACCCCGVSQPNILEEVNNTVWTEFLLLLYLSRVYNSHNSTYCIYLLLAPTYNYHEVLFLRWYVGVSTSSSWGSHTAHPLGMVGARSDESGVPHFRTSLFGTHTPILLLHESSSSRGEPNSRDFTTITTLLHDNDNDSHYGTFHGLDDSLGFV